MKIKLTSIGLLMLSLSGYAVAAQSSAEWITFSDLEIPGENGNVEAKSITELKDDGFNKQSFNIPFLITARNSLIYLDPDMEEFNNIEIAKSVVDCKNIRFAPQSIHQTGNNITGFKNKQVAVDFAPEVKVVTNFKEASSVPLELWSSFNKESMIYQETCNKTKGFDKDHVPTKDQISGWKFLDFNNEIIYVNQSDLSKADFNKPFKLRNKSFKSRLAPNSKPSTAELSELLVDCKNEKYALVKTTYFDKDYEYKPNPKPVVVDEIVDIQNVNKVEDSKWSNLDFESMNALNICQ